MLFVLILTGGYIIEKGLDPLKRVRRCEYPVDQLPLLP